MKIKKKDKIARRVISTGFEPATLRLTVLYSSIELRCNPIT